LRSKQEKEELVAGDSIRVGSPGGGGWGNPLERDLQDVEVDLNRGYISPEKAEELYGVVIGQVLSAHAGTPRYQLDADASQKQRAQRMSKA
jgi:N-methylhydantoinase B